MSTECKQYITLHLSATAGSLRSLTILVFRDNRSTAVDRSCVGPPWLVGEFSFIHITNAYTYCLYDEHDAPVFIF